MKKILFISIFYLVTNLVFSQVNPIENGIFKKEIQKQIELQLIQPKKIELPKTIKPALPQAIETTTITPEIIRPILPDEDKSDDAIIQINNLKITRILLDPGIENIKAILFAVKDIDWKCLLFESEESEKSLPCVLNIRKTILQKELAIQISNDTILLQRNRQRAKLEDFKVGDKINVYGFMDKDNYSIDALIVRNLSILNKSSEIKKQGCPLFNILPCPSGYISVFGGYMDNGCPLPPKCVPATSTRNLR
jgi:hypothetical protein